jgi:hypothetical protein
MQRDNNQPKNTSSWDSRFSEFYVMPYIPANSERLQESQKCRLLSLGYSFKLTSDACGLT